MSMLTTVVGDHALRCRSYVLIAEVFGLRGSPRSVQRDRASCECHLRRAR
jgi:hypothetical protein